MMNHKALRLNNFPRERIRPLLFIMVGTAAAMLHLFSVFCWVHFAALPPLIANIPSYLLAFSLSYQGHKKLSFGNHGNKILRLPHFFAVSLSAGMLNEILYAFLLQFPHWNYLLCLWLTISLVAIYTYFLSKHWACRI